MGSRRAGDKVKARCKQRFSDIQKQFNILVFDMVSLIEFFAAGCRLHAFKSAYLIASRIAYQK
jgi:hypothetical protein